MTYEWVTSSDEYPGSLITVAVGRDGVLFDMSLTVDGGTREQTASALGEIKEALEGIGFTVETISTTSQVLYQVQDTTPPTP